MRISTDVRHSTVINAWLGSIEQMYFSHIFVTAFTLQLTYWSTVVRIFW